MSVGEHKISVNVSVAYLYCAWNSSCTKEPGAGSGEPSGTLSSSTGGYKHKQHSNYTQTEGISINKNNTP